MLYITFLQIWFVYIVSFHTFHKDIEITKFIFTKRVSTSHLFYWSLIANSAVLIHVHPHYLILCRYFRPFGCLILPVSSWPSPFLLRAFSAILFSYSGTKPRQQEKHVINAYIKFLTKNNNYSHLKGTKTEILRFICEFILNITLESDSLRTS